MEDLDRKSMFDYFASGLHRGEFNNLSVINVIDNYNQLGLTNADIDVIKERIERARSFKLNNQSLELILKPLSLLEIVPNYHALHYRNIEAKNALFTLTHVVDKSLNFLENLVKDANHKLDDSLD